MKFTSNENNEVILRTDQGAVVLINYEYDFAQIDGVKFEFNNDTPQAIFLCVNGDFVSLYSITLKGEQHYDKIMEETRQEEQAESAMIRELSSPEYTGRI